MCYPSPGPRCYTEASRKLMYAEQAFEDATLSKANTRDLLEARRTLQAARDAVNVTTEGIAKLQADGKVEEAAHFKRRRAEQVQAWKQKCISTASSTSTPLAELSLLVSSKQNPMAARVAAIKNLHTRHPAWNSFTLKQVEGMLLYQARRA